MPWGNMHSMTMDDDYGSADDASRTRQGPMGASVAVTSTTGNPATDGESARLGRDLQTHIGDRLRSIYNAVLLEPIPDRFRALLDELEQQGGDTNPQGAQAQAAGQTEKS